MRNLHPLLLDDESTLFRDVLFLALAGFVTVLLLVLPHINPPGARQAASAEPAGNIMVEASWPEDVDADVDLWVQAPGDLPVGYSNKGGLVFNLLRDDLGRRADATPLNYEISYGRGLPAGEYVVNLHLYRNPSGRFPVPATVLVRVRKDPGQPTRQILLRRVQLRRVGEEQTVFRFRLDGDGGLVPGSVSLLPKPIRSPGRS